jgi:hypothetical protein
VTPSTFAWFFAGYRYFTGPGVERAADTT